MKDVNFVFKVFISRKCNLEMQMTLREKGRLGGKKTPVQDLIYRLSQNPCVLGSCRRCCLQNLRLCATFFSWGYLNERGLENHPPFPQVFLSSKMLPKLPCFVIKGITTVCATSHH